MRRLVLHLVIALLTFAVGVTLSARRKAPIHTLTPDEIKVCLTKTRMCVDQDLLRQLAALEEKYMERCWVYHGAEDDYKDKHDSGWRTRCYYEWEEARRVAVEGE